MNHFQLIVTQRIADHQANELAKEEATRARIRAEEQAKAEKAARALVEQEQAEARRLVTIAAFEELEADEIVRLDKLNKTMVVDVPAVQQNAPQIIQEIMQAPAANVVHLRAAAPVIAPAPATPPSMKLGDINAHLSPITLTADGLEALGFPVAAMVKGAKLYHASDLTRICGALHDLIDRVQAKQAA